MMRIRFQLLVLILMLLINAALAQPGSCKVDLPVGIIGTDGSLLEGLTAQDLTVYLHKKPLTIESVGSDAGPRRVLFILDTSRRLPVEARKAETALASYILSKARPADSFALLTARGAMRQVRFEESRDVLVKAIQELAADPKEQGKGRNILDTMMEGIQWFGQPRIGDAILMMADHLEETNEPNQYASRQLSHTGPMQGLATDHGPSFEGSSQAKFSTVFQTLADHRIRVFALQLGALKTNEALSGVYHANDENLVGISVGSGGYMVLDPMDPFGAYVMTEARERDLQQKVFQLYGAIAKFYVLRVSAPTPLPRESWKLELAKDLRRNTRALYPQLFNPCSSEEARK
ncbi:MAG TPA: hypothetical protein VG488_07470 [Candidatus Angelobacter sp.]|nr:hypothetical protein [Candidatus Angelobacter sp.]